MKINLNQKYIYILIVILFVLAIIFFIFKGQKVTEDTQIDTELTEEIQQETIDSENIGPDAVQSGLITNEEYKALINKGNSFYVKEQYAEALPYFKQALAFGESDRIYRSLYSVYLGLKDYKNAEISIKKSVSFNSGIPNNWIEYASFENYYLKAPFAVVSKVYLDGLKATKDNINLITSYASYLAEQKKYPEAISYLQKAITIDPARKAIFEAEISYLQTLK